MNEPDFASKVAYLNGADPLDHAALRASFTLEAADIVTEVRAAKGPSWLHEYGPNPTFENTARRLVADFLNAGWTPPKVRPWSCTIHDKPGWCMPKTCGAAEPTTCPECDNDPTPGRYCPTCGRYQSTDPDDPDPSPAGPTTTRS